MNKDEAIRLAAAINSLRPDWSTNGLMTILGDDRNRNRPVLDVALAFTALALDPKSRKPTRIYEHGPWWELLAPRVGCSINYRVIADNDCAICSQPKLAHPLLNDPHQWEPQHARAESHKPTPEQRAALDAAAAEAKAKATAAKEAAENAREIAPVDEVLARHTPPDTLTAIRKELTMPEPEVTEEAS